MKFFKPEDFEDNYASAAQSIASLANAKLEREGKIINFEKDYLNNLFYDGKNKKTFFISKALVINIEPIGRCEHPRDKVRWIECGTSGETNIYKQYECECGAKVQPKKFEEIK